ncbi:GmrSD restriction endonuclease domain-containing protein [Bacillus sp. OTU2372]|uniref:GmrSD restriction endonuclease domain-containing protein n=1 Tax=Bacillus sp. OTU2372 TaxID=3043858 RepID=UPI00313AC68E
MGKYEPKPEVERIEVLVRLVKEGHIKLPKFQRPFVWTKNNILELMDSIYKGYPIGSILLWLTRQKLASERSIADLEINELEEEYPTNYLLDGQQRLSSLCGILFWDGQNKNSVWNVVFDLEKEEFLYDPDNEKIEYFKLNKLLDTMDFINQCSRFVGHPKQALYTTNAQKLLNSIKDYKMASVKIGDMSLDEVAPIFERINSTGRRLTMVDLMRAATWSGEFDLTHTINMVRSFLEEKNFEAVPEIEILRNLSTCAGLGVTKEDINKLRDRSSDELKLIAEKCKKAYLHAVDFITTELHVPSHGYLPYSLQLTFLVEIFNLCPSPTVDQRKEIKKWFWRTSITRYFASFNNGQLNAELRTIRSFATGKIETLSINKGIYYKEFIESSFVLKNSVSKTFSLILANNYPKSLLDGASINIDSVLALVNKNEFHHIFPKSYLKKRNYESSQINQHANICMLNLGNNRAISNKAPSDYFLLVEERLGSNLHDILLSNFIDEDAYRCAIENNYEGFIEARKKLILRKAMELCDDLEELKNVTKNPLHNIKNQKKNDNQYVQMNLNL